MVCSVPADESEYLLTEDQLAITQTEERSVGTSMFVRVNKTGPLLIVSNLKREWFPLTFATASR
jgi:hypothetical protein